MAISYVGSSNVANGLAAGTSAVVPKPGGVVNGDFLLAFVSTGVTSAITAPPGWTEVPLGTNTAPNLQNRIYWKVASSEPASWTWTFASSAYVGICHATRGVSHVFAAQQADDGLSLLVHQTPTIAAPANAWIVSSWTGRNLLALGWAPPAGDVERQDVIGGLAVLLNVNHAVDDTNGPVAAGSYSKTALTLLGVRALDGIVALAPVMDNLVGTPVLGVASVPTAAIGRFLEPQPINEVTRVQQPFLTQWQSPVPMLGSTSVVGATLGLELALPTVLGVGSTAGAIIGLGVVIQPMPHPVWIDPPTLIPGELIVEISSLEECMCMSPPTLAPGNVNIVGMPLPTAGDAPEGTLTPGEVVLTAAPIQGSHSFSGSEQIVLGYLLSNENPISGKMLAPAGVFGLVIGAGPVPIEVPPANTVNGYEKFGPRQVVYAAGGQRPVCC